jgi:hypothetical protein
MFGGGQPAQLSRQPSHQPFPVQTEHSYSCCFQIHEVFIRIRIRGTKNNNRISGMEQQNTGHKISETTQDTASHFGGIYATVAGPVAATAAGAIRDITATAADTSAAEAATDTSTAAGVLQTSSCTSSDGHHLRRLPRRAPLSVSDVIS